MSSIFHRWTKVQKKVQTLKLLSLVFPVGAAASGVPRVPARLRGLLRVCGHPAVRRGREPGSQSARLPHRVDVPAAHVLLRDVSTCDVI